jgi:hypothetical protein
MVRGTSDKPHAIFTPSYEFQILEMARAAGSEKNTTGILRKGNPWTG